MRIESNYATPAFPQYASWNLTTTGGMVIAAKNVIGYSTASPNSLYAGALGDIIRCTNSTLGYDGWRCTTAGNQTTAVWSPYGVNAPLTVPEGAASAPSIAFTGAGGGFYASSGAVSLAFNSATTHSFTSQGGLVLDGGIVLGGAAPAIGTISAGEILNINPNAANTIFGGGSTLTSGATTGFVLLPTMSAPPLSSSHPLGSASGAAIVFDTLSGKIWVYDPTRNKWMSTAATTAG